MKSFVQIREATKKGMPPGEHVYDGKVGKHKIMIHKEKNKFVAYIDMEKLDTFNSPFVVVMRPVVLWPQGLNELNFH